MKKTFDFNEVLPATTHVESGFFKLRYTLSYNFVPFSNLPLKKEIESVEAVISLTRAATPYQKDKFYIHIQHPVIKNGIVIDYRAESGIHGSITVDITDSNNSKIYLAYYKKEEKYELKKTETDGLELDLNSVNRNCIKEIPLQRQEDLEDAIKGSITSIYSLHHACIKNKNEFKDMICKDQYDRTEEVLRAITKKFCQFRNGRMLFS